jgi:hypothetical protein
MTLNKVLGCAALIFYAGASSATVVDFDDLTGAGNLATNYAGLSWSPGWFYYDDVQPPYNPSSGVQRVYTDVSGVQQSFAFSNDVLFDGAYFAGYYSVALNLYNDDVLVHSTASIDIDENPRFLAAGYSGLIDKVVVSGTEGYFVMDDVTYHAASVPEPATVALFGLGLLGFAASRSNSAKTKNA